MNNIASFLPTTIFTYILFPMCSRCSTYFLNKSRPDLVFLPWFFIAKFIVLLKNCLIKASDQVHNAIFYEYSTAFEIRVNIWLLHQDQGQSDQKKKKCFPTPITRAYRFFFAILEHKLGRESNVWHVSGKIKSDEETQSNKHDACVAQHCCCFLFFFLMVCKTERKVAWL